MVSKYGDNINKFAVRNLFTYDFVSVDVVTIIDDEFNTRTSRNTIFCFFCDTKKSKNSSVCPSSVSEKTKWVINGETNTAEKKQGTYDVANAVLRTSEKADCWLVPNWMRDCISFSQFCCCFCLFFFTVVRSIKSRQSVLPMSAHFEF